MRWWTIIQRAITSSAFKKSMLILLKIVSNMLVTPTSYITGAMAIKCFPDTILLLEV